MQIAVAGLAATYPFGGVFWDYLQYPLGFKRLGHEVLYIEDTGKWFYSPIESAFVESGERNAAALGRALARVDPELRWFVRDAADHTYGQPWSEVVRFCEEADLFLNISGTCIMREEYRGVSCLAFLDSDPIYTQASVPGYIKGSLDAAARARVDSMRQHDVFFTFAENIGAPDCRVPTALFEWLPTRQPTVLSLFEHARVPLSTRRAVLTTVASWEPLESGPVVEGIRYFGKSVEFERFLELPLTSPLPLELALSAAAPRDKLQAHGWRLVDPLEVSRDPWDYLTYLAHSSAEWSVAKNAYVASRSGWFSCRSAVYLALGVPVIVQDTGFSRTLPTGEGILSFSTPEEALSAIHEIARDSERHAVAALEIAQEYFDSNKVLSQLLNLLP